MPIYEYRCRNCDATFEVLVRAGTTVTCLHCESSALDKLLSALSCCAGRRRGRWDIPAVVERSAALHPLALKRVGAGVDD